MKKLIVPYILIAYIAGIIIASLIKLPQVYLLGLFLLFIVLLLRQNSVKNKIFPIILIFTFFFAGYHLMYLKINFNSALLNQVNNNLILQGMVVETITYDNRVVYKLKNPIILLPDRKIYGRNEAVQLIVYDTSDTYSYGEIIEANGILEIPNSKRNPGEFDYKSYLRIRNIFTCMYVSPKDIVKVGEVIGNPFLNCASQIKNRLVNIIESLPITEKNTALGILLGDKSGFAPEDKGHFQNLGIMHIFAVSGLHVGFLIFILITLTNLLRFPALIGKTNTNIIISICLLLYCAVTGFSTPVIRSSIMLGIYLFSRNPWNNNLTANALFLSAMIILIINPLYLFDAGFQLTFSATAFIIFLSPILQKNKYFKIKNEMIAISLSAWLGTLPLTIYYFNYFAPLGVIAAIPAGLMAGIVIILGFIALVTDLVIESLTEIFVIAIGGTIYYSRVVLLLLSKLPFIGDGIITATPKVSSILTYYALFIFIFISFFHRFNPSFKLFIHKKSKVLKYLIIITVLLIILFNILTPHQLELLQFEDLLLLNILRQMNIDCRGEEISEH
jgi:competence protein ComEC